MKIAIISKSDVTGGGASRVAGDLVKVLKDHNHQVDHFTSCNSKLVSQGAKEIYGTYLAKKIGLTTGKFLRKAGFGELIPIDYPWLISAVRDYDIVHFHDTSASFSPYTMIEIAKRKKVIWTFHDCSPFTGGCLYPQMHNCQRFKQSCGDCPAKGEWPLDGYLDTTKHALEARKRLLSMPNFTAVAPSDWMANEALLSGHVERPLVISNMIDLTTFRPSLEKAALRKRLMIPQDRLVVCLSSSSIGEQRKNLAESLTAIACRGRDIFPVIIGYPGRLLSTYLRNQDFLATGYVVDRNELAEWLSASDAFITTSLADNQPLAVMEALSSGLPVYSWDTGGIPEMVQDGVTGRIFSSRSPEQLSETLVRDYRTGEISIMSDFARIHALAEFGADKFYKSHIDLYKKVLKNEI